MSKRKSYKVTTPSSSGTYAKVASDKVSAFNSRVNAAIKVANRDFQRKQKASLEKAAKIVLNA